MPVSNNPSLSLLRVGTFNVGRGLLRKLTHILTQSISLSLDIVALQEIGDPALLHHSLPQYSLSLSTGPTSFEGVGLLLSHTLTPFIRSYRRSSSGRLHAVILELTKGQQTLIASVYMPSGLDHRSPADEQTLLAHTLYRELLSWTRQVQHTIIMGDLNETLTAHDRCPRPLHSLPSRRDSASSVASPIQASLIQEGFTDTYRTLYPDAIKHPGFTHEIRTNEGRYSASRIDYIWTHGLPHSSLIQCQINRKLSSLSHHHVLHLTLSFPHPLPAQLAALTTPPRIPNLIGLSNEDKTAFTQDLEHRLAPLHSDLHSLPAHVDTHMLTSLANRLNDLTHHSAYHKLPLTSAPSFQNKSTLLLQRQRRDLTRLLHIASDLTAQGKRFTLCPAWIQIYQRCLHSHLITWTVNAFHLTPSESHVWIDETTQLIRQTRASIRREGKKMQHFKPDFFDANSTATVHRMLKGFHDGPLLSVVDSNGALTTQPDQLKAVMLDHFTQVFDIPAANPLQQQNDQHLPAAVHTLLHDKQSVDPQWYKSLMDPVTEEDLINIASDASLTSAPGRDGVATGVWKIALQESKRMREVVCTLFNACIRTQAIPDTWKDSIILPFVKKVENERTMNNIRPISLQNCLGKLFSKVLARRLGLIFMTHPILNPSQRGFLPGGTTIKCIDELLDTWSWSRDRKKALFTLFYDIQQAYDSVQLDALTRALTRIRLPAAFIALVADSLTGLSSAILTSYGLTHSFSVKRSVRQGDPLAPLLFIILMDALHDGLHTNPFTAKQHGCTLTFSNNSLYLPSLGYADDTTVICNTLDDLKIQNDWVSFFMDFNHLRLNPKKCDLVGRMADGSSVSKQTIEDANIQIAGHVPTPLLHDQSIRYLGAHFSFDGSWKQQQHQTRNMIYKFTTAVEKFKVSISQAVKMFNIFLLPRMELALHYVHGPGTSQWITVCDRLLIASIRHRASSPVRLSHSAVALSTHTLLPSWLEVSIKVSELFLRMNSKDARWGTLGRIMLREHCGSQINANVTPARSGNSDSILKRTAHLIVKSLQGEALLDIEQDNQRGNRRIHLFDTVPLDGVPNPDQCTTRNNTTR